MYRMTVLISSQCGGIGIQKVLVPVGPICVLIKPVSPWRKKWNAGLPRFRFPLRQRGVGRQKDLFPIHGQVIRDIADRWTDRDLHRMGGIRKPHDVDGIDSQLLSGIIGGLSHKCEGTEQCGEPYGSLASFKSRSVYFWQHTHVPGV